MSRKGSLGDWPTRDLVCHRAETSPEQVAVVDVDRGREWTYGALDELVDGVAARLGPGGPVGTLLDTRLAFVVLVNAAMRQGRTLVALNPELAADRLADQTQTADLDLLVCDGETVALGREVAPCEVASVDAGADSTVRSVQPGEGSVEPADVSPDETALVMFTSGTTGQPKGVRLTLGNLVASAIGSAFRLGVTPGDRWLCCLPMYHMGGLAPAIRCPLYGTSLAVQSTFEAEATASVIEEYDVTGVSLVPTQLRRLLDADWSPPQSLRAVLLGGGPAGRDLIERATERDVPVYPTYGTTETASQIATAPPEEAQAHPGTVGRPLVCTDVTVLADGERASAGETGELVVSGPTVTPGYLGEESEAFGEYGLHTGDLGYRDERGRLWIRGRLDDAITTGGETVHPETVADALTEHPAVAVAAVVGVPDEEWGERVAALVVPAGETGPGADELREWCRERVASYAVPKTVAVADGLPRTPSGTVDREAVREQLQQR